MLLVGGVTLHAASAEAAPPRKRRPPAPLIQPRREKLPTQGTVTHCSARRLYLDMGEDGGLTKGDTLTLRRGRRRTGTCTVEDVSLHRASCSGNGIMSVREGDVFSLPRPKTAVSQRERPRPLPPLDSPATLDAKREALLATPLTQVESKAESHGVLGRGGRAEVSLAGAGWASSERRPFALERVDVRLYHQPLGPLLRLDVVAGAQYWSQRPPDARFPVEQGEAELDVRRLELSTRAQGRSFALSAGRVWPEASPALGILDGVQAGWVGPDGDEVGILAGAAPGALTQGLSTQLPVAGVYAEWVGGSADSWAKWGHLSSSLLVLFPEGHDVQTQAAAAAWLALSQRLELGAELRAGAGAQRAEVLLASIDARWRWSDTVQGTVGARESTGLLELRGPWLGELQGGRTRNADAEVDWQMGRVMTWTLLTAYSEAPASDARRWLVGPEVRLALSPAWQAKVGYGEELEWVQGRLGYVQLGYTALRSGLSLLCRLQAVREQVGTSSPATSSVGGFFQGQLPLPAHLFLRAFAAGWAQRDPSLQTLSGSVVLGGAL